MGTKHVPSPCLLAIAFSLRVVSDPGALVTLVSGIERVFTSSRLHVDLCCRYGRPPYFGYMELTELESGATIGRIITPTSLPLAVLGDVLVGGY